MLDVLIPLFEKQTGYSVKTISVGTGQALALAAKGDADVALVHAPSLEKQYVAEGKLLNRRLVMYNDFVIIGPKEDPAKVAFGEKRGRRAQGDRASQSQFRFARRQLGHARVGKGALEIAGHRAEGRLVYRGWAGHGRDFGHRQRAQRLHDHGSGNLFGARASASACRF